MTWDLREREGERKRKCDMGFKRERGEKKCDLGFQRERVGERKCDLGFQRERESHEYLLWVVKNCYIVEIFNVMRCPVFPVVHRSEDEDEEVGPQPYQPENTVNRME